MCLLIIWSDVTVREGTRRLHTSKCTKFKIQKIKYLFITIKEQLITISSVIPYISKTNSTSSSLKKKKKNLKREKGRGKERKRKAKGKEEEKLKKKEKEKRERERKEESVRKERRMR